MGTHALVLNASYEPLHVVHWQRAIQLLFQGKVEVVEDSDREVRTISLTLKVPAVLRLIQYVRVPQQQQIIRFSRLNVFVRDNFTCQYCAKKTVKSQLTLDHVIPVVQRGGKSWENIVTCCKTCNQKKGGRTPEQARMKLIRKPIEPRWLPRSTFQIGFSVVPERWKIYLRIQSSD